ncbi:MAG: hypothetical protein KJO05_01960 [Bacteroidia bacterium]|nr:hypothetical protein [Bacteroidia bacterium]MBT8276047.1 hypothetical protein [Bacteroidia bacterium]NNF29973.1 hypothetical protein [Flavobacteriaceae bacterium]NNK53678.1 hypothetical protein [Flavobacteriaceae bacterium]NNM09301.1 hypothetical protein [Flavobacteriaceae bacterium]
MAALLVIIILLLLLLGYLLWMPVVLKIDTDTNEYYLQLKGLAKASVLGDDKEVLKVKLNVLFLNFNFYPLRKRKASKKKKLKAKKGEEDAEKKKRNWTNEGRRAWRVLKTFEIKQLLVELDTGDYVLNAKLYPVFFMLNRWQGSFAINFTNRNRLALIVQNRPIYILKSIINI